MINVESVAATASLGFIPLTLDIALRVWRESAWHIDNVSAITLSAVLNTKIFVPCACRFTCLDGWINQFKEQGITEGFVALRLCSFGVTSDSYA